ncbi:MAG TPA: hypothetical protein VHE30_03105 [Polyangiaceae bacterium]|nr:hypothetical protein [Polyangiaceae bacterium]
MQRFERRRNDEWQIVSAERPCAVCGARRGCRFRVDDAAYACCENCESTWPLTNGAWLHRTKGADAVGLPESGAAR